MTHLGKAALGLALASCLLANPAAADDETAAAANGERALLFADEFDAPALDRDKWIVIGPEFW
ncbi:MAG: hypothetical protein ACO25F_05665, partial [Erythrobacter sp.]